MTNKQKGETYWVDLVVYLIIISTMKNTQPKWNQLIIIILYKDDTTLVVGVLVAEDIILLTITAARKRVDTTEAKKAVTITVLKKGGKKPGKKMATAPLSGAVKREGKRMDPLIMRVWDRKREARKVSIFSILIQKHVK